VTHDLGQGVDCGDTGVSCKRLFDTPLFALGYNHYGDIDFFQTGGRGFLVVPIEGGDAGPAMAFFRGDESLEFLGLAPVAPQNKCGWVAVDPGGTFSPRARSLRVRTSYCGPPADLKGLLQQLG
jgi:hypothetical protein